jgi:hypothetical protein
MSSQPGGGGRPRHYHRAQGGRSGGARRLAQGVLAVALVLVVVGVVVALAGKLRHSSPTKQAAGQVSSTSSTSSSTTTTNAKTAADGGPRCPLSGTAPPGGKVPDRAALAVKIGNNPAARPQSGLDHADVVFEEPIEGAITRLIAVFQCQEAKLVGPIRSTRWIDVQDLSQIHPAAFAFAGGINPDRRLVASSNLIDLDFFRYYHPIFFRSSSRPAPNNLYSTTEGLWGLVKVQRAPSPIFTYASTPPAGGTAISGASLVWSSLLEVGWQWDASAKRWVRYYGSTINRDADGNGVDASNVLVLRVTTTPGPYSEDSEGDHGVRSQTVGSGAAGLLRDGEAYQAKWSRSSIDQPWRITSATTGKVLPLAPGRTWVELLPVYGSITYQGASASGSSAG